MIIESGLIVAAGLLLTFLKCSWRVRIAMLSHPLAMDLAIFICLNVIHWGTFSGVMVAAVGALTCSGLLSVGRWCFGYVHNGTFRRGAFDITHKLAPPTNPPLR